MLTITCIKCRREFEVARIIKWRYENHCNKCIAREQPYGTNSAEDARVSQLERDEVDRKYYV